MAMIRGCGECNMSTPCNGCASCLPRYLCCNVVVSPGANVDLTKYPCGPLCCQEMSFRLGGGTQGTFTIDPDTLRGVWSYNPGAVCGWGGQGACRNTAAKYCTEPFYLTVNVDIHKDVNGVCYTEITSPDILPYPIQVDGVMGKDFCTYTFDGDSVLYGAHVVVTITSGGGCVPNKTAGLTCSPCPCGTCVPSSYCVMIEVPASEVYGADPSCPSFWDAHVLTCTPSTDGTVSQQWTDKTGKPFEVGGIPYTVTMHTPSQAELDAGVAYGCCIIVRVSILNAAQYIGAPPVVVPYNQFIIPLELAGFNEEDPTRPAKGYACKEQNGSRILTRNLELTPTNPTDNAIGVKVNTDTDQAPAAIKALDNTALANLVILETCCNTPCVPPTPKCWTGCREIGIVYGGMAKCNPITLYATVIAPGNTYDGFVVPISNTDTSGAQAFLSNMKEAFCAGFSGAATPPSSRAGNAGTIGLWFALAYGTTTCDDGPIPDDPGGYRLTYYLGESDCVKSLGVASMVGNSNIMGLTNVEGLSPTYASCSPFRLDFAMPAICSGNQVAGTIVSTVPYSVGDAGGTWTLRITQ